MHSPLVVIHLEFFAGNIYVPQLSRQIYKSAEILAEAVWTSCRNSMYESVMCESLKDIKIGILPLGFFNIY